MSTVQVAIEYILVGLLMIGAYVAPFLRGRINPASFSSEALIGVLGAAYLLGVVFDKLADTMLGSLEHRLRLDRAARSLELREKKPRVDPFPQDRLEDDVRTEEDVRHEWLDALRSRIRICRGLAVFTLPACLGTLIGLAQHHAIPGRAWWVRASLVVPSAVLFAIGAIAINLRRSPIRTDDLSETEADRSAELKTARTGAWADTGWLFATMALSELGLLLIAWQDRHALTAVIGIGGLVVALTAFWSWWRITETYLGFLSRTNRKDRTD